MFFASGFVRLNDDCDDENADRSPSATETCNGIDDNCDGATDEDVLLLFYDDEDGDGWHTTFEAWNGQRAPLKGDCDDTAEVNPVLQLCDGDDNNCNGLVDEEALDRTAWFSDPMAMASAIRGRHYLCDATRSVLTNRLTATPRTPTSIQMQTNAAMAG